MHTCEVLWELIQRISINWNAEQSANWRLCFRVVVNVEWYMIWLYIFIYIDVFCLDFLLSFSGFSGGRGCEITSEYSLRSSVVSPRASHDWGVWPWGTMHFPLCLLPSSRFWKTLIDNMLLLHDLPRLRMTLNRFDDKVLLLHHEKSLPGSFVPLHLK